MRVLAVSLSFVLALGLAAPRGALADPPAPSPPAPDTFGTPTSPYVPGPAPYVLGSAPSAADPAPSAGGATSKSGAADPGVARGGIRHPFFVGITGGVAWASPNILGLQPQSFVGANIGVEAGYTINQHFSAGFEFTTVEKAVTRGGPLAPFSVPLSPQAGCDSCPPVPTGGWVAKTTLFFGQLAPRVEYTPFGESGLFVGASAGLALIQLLTPRAGFGGALRAGYRFRLAKILDLGVEAGAQGQAYQDGTVLMVSGLAVFRPHI